MSVALLFPVAVLARALAQNKENQREVRVDYLVEK